MTSTCAESKLLPAAANGTAEGQGRSILVVEDQEFVRKVTCEVLSFAGYEVLEARTAAEAARLFDQHWEHVELLLADVVLPGRDGYTLARELRALEPGLKTIFISGYPENKVAKSDLQEPDVFYLAKPFSVEALLRKVAEVLGNDGMAEGRAGVAKHASHSA